MKKIKIFTLLTLIILTCTGCTVEYNVNITKNNISEEITVNDYITSIRTKENILSEYNTWYPTYVNFITEGESIEIEDYSRKYEGIEYHQKDIKELNDGYKYTYKYIYPIDQYNNAYTLARTYLESSIYQGYNNLIIKTSKENFLCNYDYFDEVKVNITIDPKVYELNYTNTSNINDNTYTWTLNRSNCNNSEIVLTLNKINQYNEIINEKDNGIKVRPESEYTLYIFLGVILLIILIVYFIFKKLKEKNEKMDLDD